MPRKPSSDPAIVRKPSRVAAPAMPVAPSGAVPMPGNSMIELITLQWRRERPDMDLFEFLLAICFMRLGTMVDRHFANMCQQRHGISGTDMRVLLALRRGGQPFVKRPTDLFKALLVTSGAMTKKVDRLAALEMVERLPDPGNSGGFLIRLTRKGQKAADDASEQVAADSAIASAMRQFTAAEREAGQQFVVRTLAAMEQAGISKFVDSQGEEAEKEEAQKRRARKAR